MAVMLPAHGIDELGQLLPPVASSHGKDLADLMNIVTLLETSVNSLAQRLTQVHFVQQALCLVILGQ